MGLDLTILFTVLSMIADTRKCQPRRLGLTAQQLSQLTTVESGVRTFRREYRAGVVALLARMSATEVWDETLRGVGQIWAVRAGDVSAETALDVARSAWAAGETVLVSVDSVFPSDGRADPTMVSLRLPELAVRLTGQDGGRFAALPAPVGPTSSEVE